MSDVVRFYKGAKITTTAALRENRHACAQYLNNTRASIKAKYKKVSLVTLLVRWHAGATFPELQFDLSYLNDHDTGEFFRLIGLKGIKRK